MPAASPDLLRRLVEPICTEAGLDLEDVQVTPAGRRRRVRLVVDRDGGVELDECAALSHRVSAALDDADLLGDVSYTLEVSSPGVSRPLTQPRHWRRNAGRLVRVLGPDGAEVTGRVLAADDDGADLDVDGRAHRVPYSEVAKATVQVEFRSLDDEPR